MATYKQATGKPISAGNGPFNIKQLQSSPFGADRNLGKLASQIAPKSKQSMNKRMNIIGNRIKKKMTPIKSKIKMQVKKK